MTYRLCCKIYLYAFLIYFSSPVAAEVSSSVIAVGTLEVDSEETSMSLSPTFNLDIIQPQLLLNNSNTASFKQSTVNERDLAHWQSQSSITVNSPAKVLDATVSFNHLDSDLLQEDTQGQKSDNLTLITGANLETGSRVDHRIEIVSSEMNVENFIGDDKTKLSIKEESINYSLNMAISPFVSTLVNKSYLEKDSGAKTHILNLGLDIQNPRHIFHLDVGESITRQQSDMADSFTGNFNYSSISEGSIVSFDYGMNQSDSLSVFEITDVPDPINFVSEVTIENAILSIQKLKLSDQLTFSGSYEVGQIKTLNEFADESEKINTEYDAGNIGLAWNLSKKSQVNSRLLYSFVDDTADWSGAFSYSSVLSPTVKYRLSFNVNKGDISAKVSATFQPNNN